MITPEYLKQCLDYNEESGDFIWKKRPIDHFATKEAWGMFNTKLAGKIAGCRVLNRYTIGINGKTYLANRLAQIFMGNKLDGDSYSVAGNGNHYDCSASNLSLVSRSHCAIKRKHPENENRNIYKKRNGKFEVSIKRKQKIIYGGVFDGEESARVARDNILKSFVNKGEN